MSQQDPHVEIVIVEYDPRWPLLYAEERERVATALDGLFGSIEHIGSTSVPSLAAKPIIDLLVTVSQLGPPDSYVERLAPLDYTLFLVLGSAQRYAFGRGDPHTHHLHIVEHGGEEHLRHIAFRDYLRAHPDTAGEYARLTRELARRFQGNRQAYNEAKTAFVREIEARSVR